MKNIRKDSVNLGENCYYLGRYGFAIFRCVEAEKFYSCRFCYLYENFNEIGRVCDDAICMPRMRDDANCVIFVKRFGILINFAYLCKLIYGKLR